MLYNHNKPTLIIDTDTCRKNIGQFVSKAKEQQVIFRPHFKTHQSLTIGRWFKDFGVDKIAVSSYTMAKYFVEDGWKDVTIAFPLNIHEIHSIIQLSQHAKIHITIANLESLKILKTKEFDHLGIFLEMDTGYHRSGIDSTDKKLMDSIVTEIRKSEKLEFKGFLSHFGHTYYPKNIHNTEDIYKSEVEILHQIKTKYLDDFPHIVVSVGDTPGLRKIKKYHHIDEIRPGNFVFYDEMQVHLNACTHKDIAVALACPVVDINASRNQIVVYGGAVHLSKDSILVNDQPFYGAVVRFKEKAWTEPIKDTFVVKLSQEHGIIQTQPDIIKTIKIGDILGILPVHSCLTAHIMKGYYDVKGSFIDHMNFTR